MNNIGKSNKSEGAKRSNRALRGICIVYAAECPVSRENTEETVETCYRSFGASSRRRIE